MEAFSYISFLLALPTLEIPSTTPTPTPTPTPTQFRLSIQSPVGPLIVYISVAAGFSALYALLYGGMLLT